jgi:hypothetical protein
MNETRSEILWHALFRGELCRIRNQGDGGLICEAWRNGSWVAGPDFAELDFKGRMIFEDEADEWIRRRFREKKLKQGLVKG